MACMRHTPLEHGCCFTRSSNTGKVHRHNSSSHVQWSTTSCLGHHSSCRCSLATHPWVCNVLELQELILHYCAHVPDADDLL